MSKVKPSLWEKTSQHVRFPHLNEKLNVEVAIIGGGITGITLADRLAQKGMSVALIERDQLSSKTSGQTSAHLTSHWDLNFSDIKKQHGVEAVRHLYMAMRKAIDYICEQSLTFTEDVGFKYVNGYLYRENNEQEDKIDEERQICLELGLEIEDMPKDILPFSFLEGICLKNQAIFHPKKYLEAMTHRLEDEGVLIFENSPVIEIDGNQIETPQGTIRSKCIVHATHSPLGIHVPHAAMEVFRSYVVAGPYQGKLADALFWDLADPYHYVRKFSHNGETFLLVGGEDKHVGHNEEPQAFDALEDYARTKFGLQEITYRWSSQFYKPSDSLPFIGKSPGHKDTYIATGFSGDGLTMGTASALILADLITNGSHPWEKTFSPTRASALNTDFLKNNLHVMSCMLKDRFGGDDISPKDLKLEEGCVHHSLLEPTAYYKDAEGRLYQMSAVCPHMKCVVHWNAEQKSFDCPCHGSRFTTEGRVIEGPAMKGLSDHRPVKDE